MLVTPKLALGEPITDFFRLTGYSGDAVYFVSRRTSFNPLSTKRRCGEIPSLYEVLRGSVVGSIQVV